MTADRLTASTWIALNDYVPLNMAYGLYTILGLYQDMVHGPKFMHHLVLIGWFRTAKI